MTLTNDAASGRSPHNKASQEQADAAIESLVDVNSLIPLIVELLELNQEDLQRAVLKAVVPAIDEVITQNNQQNPQKLSAAIAAVLPGAIAHQIKNHPEAIAKAIATVQIGLPSITTRIYFNSGSAQMSPNNSRSLSSVEQVLAQNPGIHLRIIGHSDSTGQPQ